MMSEPIVRRSYVIMLQAAWGMFPVGTALSPETAEGHVRDLKKEFPQNTYHIYEVEKTEIVRRIYPNLGA